MRRQLCCFEVVTVHVVAGKNVFRGAANELAVFQNGLTGRDGAEGDLVPWRDGARVEAGSVG